MLFQSYYSLISNPKSETEVASSTDSFQSYYSLISNMTNQGSYDLRHDDFNPIIVLFLTR